MFYVSIKIATQADRTGFSWTADFCFGRHRAAHTLATINNDVQGNIDSTRRILSKLFDSSDVMQ